MSFGTWLFTRRAGAASSRAVLAAPLLGADELQRLYLQAAAPSVPDPARREVAHRRAGDQRGRRRGVGMDYDDSRRYQPGDEPRQVNWRLSARSGALQTKLYREERRALCCVLMDRRASMVFGSRERLKVTQAARAATLAAFAAAQAGEEVAALILRPSGLHWVEARGGIQAAFELARQFAAPRAPAYRDRWPQPSLDQALALLLERLPDGSRVLLVSDFIDLEPALESDRGGGQDRSARTAVSAVRAGPRRSPRPPSRQAARLSALGARHQIEALHVADPAEQRLPRTGPLTLVAAGGDGSPRRVDCGDPDLRRGYEQAAARHFAAREALLRAAGADYRLLTTPQ